MSWGRRGTALLVLATAGPWLTGCGDSDPQRATSPTVVIPGSTVTISDAPADPQDIATTDPSDPADPTTDPTTDPTADPVEGAATTPEELVASLAAAFEPYETVHVSTLVGDLDLETDHQVVSGNDYTGELTDDGRTVQLRRVGETLYVEPVPGDGFVAYTDGDEVAAGGLSPDYLTWRVVVDLANALGAASGFEAEDALTYTWSVPWSAFKSSPNVDGEGEAQATLEVDEEGLPVRLELADATGGAEPISFDYSAWGEPVTVEVPDVG